jgi:hypothetical protein
MPIPTQSGCFLQKTRVGLATFLKRMKCGDTRRRRDAPAFCVVDSESPNTIKNLYSNFLIVDGST